MYETLVQTVLLEEDARVTREVERIRSRHPRSSDAEVVRRLTTRAAWRCAAVGAIASAGEPGSTAPTRAGSCGVSVKPAAAW